MRGKKTATVVATMIKLTDALDKAEAHANRHKFHLPSSADAAECASTRAKLMAHVQSSLQAIKKANTMRNQRAHFDALTYFLAWKDLRGETK